MKDRHVNDYIQSIIGSNFTAKDFRTWAGTMLAARALREIGPAASEREARRNVIRQLAEMTRRIHDSHFFHHDLVWRNVLVTGFPFAPARLWWIDCPRGAVAVS